MIIKSKDTNMFLSKDKDCVSRLTPALTAIVFWYAFVMEYIGTGPQWNSVIKSNADICKKNAWTNLLYIQNFFPFEEMVKMLNSKEFIMVLKNLNYLSTVCNSYPPACFGHAIVLAGTNFGIFFGNKTHDWYSVDILPHSTFGNIAVLSYNEQQPFSSHIPRDDVRFLFAISN